MSAVPTTDNTATDNRRRSPQFLGMTVGAVACGLAVVCAILIAHPYVEAGISDDFSYVRIAQVLAQTGHIVYTGWATPILGWQLYLAAAFIKLFGFSFTATRASIMFVSVVTAVLCQRTLVRAGISEWNATIGSLTLMLCPLVMPLEVTFMTDIPGLFATILCFYACLRGVQSRTTRGAIAWIGFAAVSNVIFGSSRQIAWLGVLVMVPSAVWILRKSRAILFAGCGFWAVGGAFVVGINYWFEHQPYTQIEKIIDHRIHLNVLEHLVEQMLRASLEVVLLLLPVLLMFLPALKRRTYPWQVMFGAALFAAGVVYLFAAHNVGGWFAPFLAGVIPYNSAGWMRPILSIAVVVCALAVLTAIFVEREKVAFSHVPEREACDETIAILLVPFTIAYVGLLLPRAGFEGVWDRYVVPLLFVGLIFAIRFYQRHFRVRLPVVALVLAVCTGAYEAAVIHDHFALHRAWVKAIDEVLATGVPATSVSGGWDYDGWTELQYSSHVMASRMRVPPGAIAPKPTHYGLAYCPEFYCDMFPHVVPSYTVSLRPDPIPGTTFVPVPFKTWVTPAGVVYVVHFPDRAVDGQVP